MLLQGAGSSKKQADVLLRVDEALHVSHVLASLDREKKVLWSALVPGLKDPSLRQPVKGEIDLYGVEPFRVEVKPLPLGQSLRVEDGFPVLVDPTRSTDSHTARFATYLRIRHTQTSELPVRDIYASIEHSKIAHSGSLSVAEASTAKDGSGPNRIFTDIDYRDQADFRYALRMFVRFSELQARATSITPQQHMLLLQIRGHPSYPAVNIGDVAERLQVRHHSASLLVERCVRRGLLNRQQDGSDKRRVVVSLTPEGEDILERISRANRQELRSLDADLFRHSFIEAVQQQEAEKST